MSLDLERAFDQGREDAVRELSSSPMARFLLKRAAWKDKIPGGLADKKKPSDFDPRELKKGEKVEREHTSDKHIAEEISMDHLTEDPKYYEKLKKVEKK